MISKGSELIATTRFIRLTYYNDVLLKKGEITEREHQKMYNAILAKYQSTKHTNASSLLRNSYR